MPWRRVINIHILAVIIPAIARLTPVFWRFLNLYSITDRSSFLTVTCSVTVVIIITIDITYAPFTRYNRLSNRLYNRLDNRLYRVNKHPTGCQTGCQTGLTTGLTTGLYTIQPVVKRLSSRFDNRLDNRLHRVNGALLFYSKVAFTYKANVGCKRSRQPDSPPPFVNCSVLSVGATVAES